MSVSNELIILFKDIPKSERIKELEKQITTSNFLGKCISESNCYDLIKDGKYKYDYMRDVDPENLPPSNPLLFGVVLNHLRYSFELFKIDKVGSDRYSKADLSKLRNTLVFLMEQKDMEAVYYFSDGNEGWIEPLSLSDLKQENETL